MTQVRSTKIEAYFQWNTSEARWERTQHVTDSSSCSEGAEFLFWTTTSAPLLERLLITCLLMLLLLLWDVYHSANMLVIEGRLCLSKLESSCLVFQKPAPTERCVFHLEVTDRRVAASSIINDSAKWLIFFVLIMGNVRIYLRLMSFNYS